jgi:hypothetical protein
MRKIEGTARFANAEDAQRAVDRLVEVRHDPGNALDGGAAELRADGDATLVRFSYRVRGDAPRTAHDQLTKQVKDAVKAGEAEVNHGLVEYDEEQYVDPDTGQVKTQQANRVVQTYTDADGTEQTRVLISTTRLVRAVDDSTGEEVGKVAVRTITDQDGNKVVFEGDRGTPEQNVVVETGR